MARLVNPCEPLPTTSCSHVHAMPPLQHRPLNRALHSGLIPLSAASMQPAVHRQQSAKQGQQSKRSPGSSTSASSSSSSPFSRRSWRRRLRAGGPRQRRRRRVGWRAGAGGEPASQPAYRLAAARTQSCSTTQPAPTTHHSLLLQRLRRQLAGKVLLFGCLNLDLLRSTGGGHPGSPGFAVHALQCTPSQLSID